MPKSVYYRKDAQRRTHVVTAEYLALAYALEVHHSVADTDVILNALHHCASKLYVSNVMGMISKKEAYGRNTRAVAFDQTIRQVAEFGEERNGATVQKLLDDFLPELEKPRTERQTPLRMAMYYFGACAQEAHPDKIYRQVYYNRFWREAPPLKRD